MTEATHPDFNAFTAVGALLWYDGPLAEHYKDPQGNDWIYSFANCGERGASPWEWVWFQVPNYADYFEGRVSFHDIMKNSPQMWRSIEREGAAAGNMEITPMTFEEMQVRGEAPAEETIYDKEDFRPYNRGG